MAGKLCVDLDKIDTSHVIWDAEEIERINPHRGHMRLLDGVVYASIQPNGESYSVGYKDCREDEFWVEGHIPGRPLLPGVLMVEAAAQFAGLMLNKRNGNKRFIGFTGVDKVKFRGQVVPGDRLWLVGQEIKFSERRMICEVQGVCNGKLAFEAKVVGMPI